MTARRTTAPPRLSHGDPGLLVSLGGGLIGLWFFLTTMQIQTSEALINGGTNTKNILQPQWSIWFQFPKLFLGDNIPGPAIASNEVIGIIVAWTIELFFLSMVIGFEVALHHSKKLGESVRALFWIFLIFVGGYNAWSDANYGNISFLSHLIFAAIVSAVVSFALPFGIALIRTGWRHA